MLGRQGRWAGPCRYGILGTYKQYLTFGIYLYAVMYVCTSSTERVFQT